MNELIQVGALEGKHEQSNRIYSEYGVCPTIMAGQRRICTGGYISPKILVNKETEGRIMKEFTNNLVKYNFEMENIKLFDSFAGIGALHQSLKELGVPVDVVGLSEVDIDAIISYAGVHIDNFMDLDFIYPTEVSMKDWLMSKNIGWDFMKQKSSIPRLKKDKLYKVYKASVLLNNLGDISKLDYKNLPDFDLFNFSFSCTDYSNAGHQKGAKNEDGTLTRSGLYVYGLEVIKHKKPKYIMIENVKGLIQKKFIDDFYGIVSEIESYGYMCHYFKKENGQPTCLNAKDYGIPQNRGRIFIICIRNDIDTDFNFPVGFDNGIRLKDILENEVDEKYYISQEKCEKLIQQLNDKNSLLLDMCQAKREGKPREYTDFSLTLSARDYKEPRLINKVTVPCTTPDIVNKTQNGRRFKEDGDPMFTLTAWDRHGILEAGYYPYLNSDKKHQSNTIYNTEGICPTIDTTQDGNIQPKVMVKEATKKGYAIAYEGDSINLEQPNSKTRRGRVGKQVAQTLTCSCNQATLEGYRIRKLTPKECWRLMGFRDECFDRAKELGISDSALYKQAGNSIVVNVLYHIFKNLFSKSIV